MVTILFTRFVSHAESCVHIMLTNLIPESIPQQTQNSCLTNTPPHQKSKPHHNRMPLRFHNPQILSLGLSSKRHRWTIHSDFAFLLVNSSRQSWMNRTSEHIALTTCEHVFGTQKYASCYKVLLIHTTKVPASAKMKPWFSTFIYFVDACCIYLSSVLLNHSSVHITFLSVCPALSRVYHQHASPLVLHILCE